MSSSHLKLRGRLSADDEQPLDITDQGRSREPNCREISMATAATVPNDYSKTGAATPDFLKKNDQICRPLS